MADRPKSKLWEFLNSNFGLFIMSSIVVSFITWSYTQLNDSLERKKVLTEKLSILETEISYRVQVMQNYFESECSEDSNLSRKTFEDIDEIYSAAPSYKPIFPENADKELHTLIWELSAVQKGNTKQQSINCFDSLLQFNYYLNRLQNQVDTQGRFYGREVNYKKEVTILIKKFTSAMELVDGISAPMVNHKSEIVSEEEETSRGDSGRSEENAVEHEEGHGKSTQSATLQLSIQELVKTLNDHAPIPGSITPHTQFDAEVYFLTKDDGGRDTQFLDGYRPQFYFRTIDVPGSIRLPKGPETVMPGDHITIKVELHSEIAMEEGLHFAVREGSRTVGTGIVTSHFEDD